MSYQLGEGVKVGEKILLPTGSWTKVIRVTEKGVETEAGFIEYGWKINGWKKL